MTLKEKIQGDLKSALKERKEREVSTLRMLWAAIFNKEKEKRYRLSQEKSGIVVEELKKESRLAQELEKESALTDEEVIEAIFSEIKKRKEAILEFENGGREDLVKIEKEELEILQKYLPKQLSEEEIRKLVQEAISALKASFPLSEQEKIGIKHMGKIMANLMPKLKGRADGQLVSKIVKELLGSNEKI